MKTRTHCAYTRQDIRVVRTLNYSHNDCTIKCVGHRNCHFIGVKMFAWLHLINQVTINCFGDGNSGGHKAYSSRQIVLAKVQGSKSIHQSDLNVWKYYFWTHLLLWFYKFDRWMEFVKIRCKFSEFRESDKCLWYHNKSHLRYQFHIILLIINFVTECMKCKYFVP